MERIDDVGSACLGWYMEEGFIGGWRKLEHARLVFARLCNQTYGME